MKQLLELVLTFGLIHSNLSANTESDPLTTIVVVQEGYIADRFWVYEAPYHWPPTVTAQAQLGADETLRQIAWDRSLSRLQRMGYQSKAVHPLGSSVSSMTVTPTGFEQMGANIYGNYQYSVSGQVKATTAITDLESRLTEFFYDNSLRILHPRQFKLILSATPDPGSPEVQQTWLISNGDVSRFLIQPKRFWKRRVLTLEDKELAQEIIQAILSRSDLVLSDFSLNLELAPGSRFQIAAGNPHHLAKYIRAPHEVECAEHIRSRIQMRFP